MSAAGSLQPDRICPTSTSVRRSEANHQCLHLAHLPRSGRRENRVRLRYYIPRAGQTAGVPVDDPKAADLAHVGALRCGTPSDALWE